MRRVEWRNQIRRAGLQLYRDRPDKRYSLTDCISMQTMRREGLTEVLTNDRHFEQEGFRCSAIPESTQPPGSSASPLKPS